MDTRTVELINLELDGRLDAAGRAELEAALANDPAARTRREQLRAVARALADAPAPSLPLDFRDSLLRRLPQRGVRAVGTRRVWRGGLALAASVVAAVVVLRVAQHEPADVRDQLGATLAPATATVTPQRQPGGLALGFALPPGPADLILEFPGEGALAATADRGLAPVVEGRRIVVRVTGGQVTVRVTGEIDEFEASLARGGVVTPVTVRAR